MFWICWKQDFSLDGKPRSECENVVSQLKELIFSRLTSKNGILPILSDNATHYDSSKFHSFIESSPDYISFPMIFPWTQKPAFILN